jgi:hydroxymethylpyrimidine pyrophosphatase-like HAD family hydrolase
MTVYCFDIDGTICTNTDGDYENALPYREVIEKINRLYSDGHSISLYTARGSTTHIDWYDFTKRQLKEWGVKYHELIMGKPYADLYIDDKGMQSEVFFTKCLDKKQIGSDKGYKR